ncbi:MAG: hypothetical protein WCC60_16680 [Ilumatobacteraceae bacterium]
MRLRLRHGGISHSDLMFDSLGSVGESHRAGRVRPARSRLHRRRERPWHYDAIATETIGVLATVVSGVAHLVGYSAVTMTAGNHRGN